MFKKEERELTFYQKCTIR